jgi:hypothetical protein
MYVTCAGQGSCGGGVAVACGVGVSWGPFGGLSVLSPPHALAAASAVDTSIVRAVLLIALIAISPFLERAGSGGRSQVTDTARRCFEATRRRRGRRHYARRSLRAAVRVE